MNPLLVPLAACLTASPPWLAPYRAMLHQLLESAHSRSIVEALNATRTASTSSLRFVDHSRLPPGEPYESFIARTACIPTRENLHDFFNGLMWLCYPQTKRSLNALQAQEIAQRGPSGLRGALRDALTLFDENAALLAAPTVLTDALRRRDWKALFIEHRPRWSSAHLVLFGHALIEKLMQPRKAITAHVWLVDGLSDDAVASSLSSERLAAKDFLPLPVLGAPGWCSENDEPGFYDDADVFRAPR